MGVPRHDAAARRVAVLRNWEFFRAPLGAVVCMHRDLDYVDALGVGMFLQTFMLALTARGIGSCVQVSIAGYPEVIREQLGIAEDMRILCGVSIGYPDPSFAANTLDVPAQSARRQRHLPRDLSPYWRLARFSTDRLTSPLITRATSAPTGPLSTAPLSSATRWNVVPGSVVG